MTTGFVIGLEGVVVTTPVMSLVASVTDFVEEIDVLIEAADSGRLASERTLELCVKLLRDHPLGDIVRRVGAVSLDQDVLRFLQADPARSHVVTSLPDAWVTPIFEQLPCATEAASGVVEEGRLTAIHAKADKRAVVERFRHEFDTVVAVGAGSDDVAMLEAADLKVVFGDAPPRSVVEIADYLTPTGGALWNLLTSL